MSDGHWRDPEELELDERIVLLRAELIIAEAQLDLAERQLGALDS